MRAAHRLLAAGALATALAACAQEAPQAVPVARNATSLSPPPSPIAPETQPPVVQSGDGDLARVAAGAGRSTADATTYLVEVEGGLGIDPVDFARRVDRTLADPRSWGAGGRRTLQRVDDDDADVRIALASPELTDQLCAPLETGGYFSCANGARAVVNVARWLQGAPSYEGHLEDYRAYVVNHEVGHALGFGHATCPGTGVTAPVMLQQTKGLDGCARGPWPYP